MNSNPKLTGDHYFPAAVIGGFGVLPKPGKKSGRRYAKVSVRFRDNPDTVRPTTAEAVARENGGYRLTSPPPGLLPDAIDELWDSYEPCLPNAISAVERNRYSGRDWAVIGLHLAAQGVRHPDFLRQARVFLAAQGAPVSDSDLPQLQRIKTLEDGFALLSQSKLALLSRASESRRFVVNDKGYSTLQDPETRQIGVFFPLSSSLMILSVIGSGASDGWDSARPKHYFRLTPAAVQLLNEASWRQSGVKCVMGHPDDSSWIGQLDLARPLIAPRLGPYRGVSGGFFDWASDC
jgi:hypothetical protein